MSPAPPPREPAPFAPRITLNLRNGSITDGYSHSLHVMDKYVNNNNNNGELYADDDMDIQEEDKSPVPPPCEPAPFSPHITLNLRNDSVTDGYSHSLRAMDKYVNNDNNNGELYADDDIQAA